MAIISDSIGKKINSLLILERIGKRKVKCQCECGNIKEIDFYDIKRNFTKSCGCQANSSENREKSRIRANKMREEGILNTGGDYSTDAMTPFRYTWKCINNKFSKRKPVDISIEDLSTIWDKQNGICPYSKIKLILPTHTNLKEFKSYMYASLDRIDSNEGYTINNCQFISRSLNYAKNSMSHNEFEDFLIILRNGGKNE